MNDAAPTTPATDAPPPQKRRGGLALVIIITAVGLGLLAVFYYGILNPPSQRVSAGTAPAFEFTNYEFGLSEFDGQTFTLNDFRGKPVVLNFWASWCIPCRDEQAALESMWQKHRDQVTFVGLDYLDQEPNARSYLQEFQVTYPNGPDKGSRAYTAYRVQGVPETFFIDANGQVVGFYVGPIPTPELERRIQELLVTSEAGSS